MMKESSIAVTPAQYLCSAQKLCRHSHHGISRSSVDSFARRPSEASAWQKSAEISRRRAIVADG
jgi:hypothetical protein